MLLFLYVSCLIVLQICYILNESWILVLHIMSLDSSSFVYVSHLSSIHVMIVDDTLIHLTGVGFVITPHLSLLNIYLILKLTLNIASIGQLCHSSNYLVIFFLFFFYYVQNIRSQKLIRTGRRKGELYILDELKVLVFSTSSVLVVATIGVKLSSFRLSPYSSFYLWHSHLGHVSSSRFLFLAST